MVGVADSVLPMDIHAQQWWKVFSCPLKAIQLLFITHTHGINAQPQQR